jgi:iron(III) transport system permease protein
VFLHSIAGLPWVVLIVGRGLRAVERSLEEDALLLMPGWLVLFRVTLPRASASILAAGLCVALQTAGEITITDLMQVRTYAEEVYTQLVGPDTTPGAGSPLARAVLGSLGQLLLTVAVVLLLLRRVERLVPGGFVQGRAPERLRLGRWLRWPFFAGFLLLAMGLLVDQTTCANSQK